MPFRPPSARPPAPAPTAPRVRSRSEGARRLGRALALAAALAGCAGPGDGFAPPADEAERAMRIARLEARLANDRAALADLVATPRDVEQAPLEADPALRALADRVVADSAALDRLRQGATSEDTGS